MSSVTTPRSNIAPAFTRWLLALLMSGPGCHGGADPKAEDTGGADADEDGYVIGPDCDDADPAVNPAAEERCDGVDNDCDGQTDEEAVDASTWYVDADGDDFGDPETAASGCEQPEGAVTSAGDCDDDDATVWSGAPERCGDGVVNDCDGTEEDADASCALAGEHDLGDADLRLRTDGIEEVLGSEVAAAGDVDGDGLADVLVAAYSADEGGVDGGAVYVVAGTLTGDLLPADATARLLGADEDQLVGFSVAGAQDNDADGYDDVLIGSLGGSDCNGAVWLESGPLDGVNSLLAADATLSSDTCMSADLVWLSDATGDGSPDLLIDWANGGAAAIYAGPVLGTVDEASASATFVSGAADDYGTGISLDGAGDLDGDGIEDIVLAGCYEDDGELGDRFYVVHSPVSGSLDLRDADATMETDLFTFSAGIGSYIAAVSGAGDFDGDGLDDLMLGAALFGATRDGGTVWVLPGTIEGAVDAGASEAVFEGSNEFDWAGWSVADGGDVDADGGDDLLIGAPGAESSRGVTYVVFGPASGTHDLDEAGVLLLGERHDDEAGKSVASAGDVDTDGRDDILIGAPEATYDGEMRGAAYLIRDAAGY